MKIFKNLDNYSFSKLQIDYEDMMFRDYEQAIEKDLDGMDDDDDEILLKTLNFDKNKNNKNK